MSQGPTQSHRAMQCSRKVASARLDCRGNAICQSEWMYPGYPSSYSVSWCFHSSQSAWRTDRPLHTSCDLPESSLQASCRRPFPREPDITIWSIPAAGSRWPVSQRFEHQNPIWTPFDRRFVQLCPHERKISSGKGSIMPLGTHPQQATHGLRAMYRENQAEGLIAHAKPYGGYENRGSLK